MFSPTLLTVVLLATTPGASTGEPAADTCDEVLEIAAKLHPALRAGEVEICGCARFAGYRTKLVVKGGDTPVEDFVGPGGAFIKPIVQALDGEVIDIVPEDPDPARAVTLALAPARLVRIYLDEEAYAMDLVVVDEDLDKARGPEGQHLQLVSNLTGWTLAVYTETRDEEMRQQARATFGQVLGLDEAQIDSLVAWGFLDLQTIAAADSTELASILGYSPEQVRALQARAAQKP